MKRKIKICIIRSLYNDTSKLLQSAVTELKKRKIIFKIIEVPGAFEIPVVLARNIKKYDGFIALGSIIKGGTPNFEFISSAITNGLIQVSVLYKKPIGNAIITCLNEKQARARSSKGFEAAIAVCDVLNAK
ncbi:6,7-dimethyl-8-ribityllumazine synthase [Pelagibacteraceae bacterium]|nr:6,7-dimethyl-8-ribityllumazine synthase [Pelagibacteraceae bacterium]|tara:strand:+ start:347 stop:739 length:393 start_codon:yes stop_codon:yes gene_type:complete